MNGNGRRSRTNGKKALKSLSCRVQRVTKQGVSGSKNGRLLSSVSAVRFKETAKQAAPQNRYSDQPSLAVGHNPALRQQGK